MVNFAARSMHHFVNGYTTILNCPAVRRRTCFRTCVLSSLFDHVELYDNEYHLLNDVSMCRVRLCRFHRTDARQSNGVSVPIFIPFMMDISFFTLLSLDHREQGHRVLHELLTGGSSPPLIDEDLNDE